MNDQKVLGVKRIESNLQNVNVFIFLKTTNSYSDECIDDTIHALLGYHYRTLKGLTANFVAPNIYMLT